MLAAWTRTARIKPCVSTSRCRWRPKIFFSAVEAAFSTSHRTGLDRLAIDDRGAWLLLAPHLDSHLFAQGRHGSLPGAIEFPLAERMVHRLAVGQIVGHLPPRTAGSQQVEDA